jgi:hypothetical protein
MFRRGSKSCRTPMLELLLLSRRPSLLEKP